VRIIVAFTAGGTTNIIARLVRNPLPHPWDQPVWWRTASARAATSAPTMIRSAPDGCILLAGSTGVGTASHLEGALLSRMLEVELTHCLSAVRWR
jgi:tripartite-type tricarboxylate transporter receptor subunit TctC